MFLKKSFWRPEFLQMSRSGLNKEGSSPILESTMSFIVSSVHHSIPEFFLLKTILEPDTKFSVGSSTPRVLYARHESMVSPSW